MNRNPHTNRQTGTKDAAILAEKRRIAALQKKRARKKLIEKVTAVTVFSVIGAVIALSVIFGYIFFDFRSTEKIPNEKISVEYDKKEAVLLDEDCYFYRDGEYYVSLTELCKTVPFTLHGNVEKMTLTVSDGIFASFDVGTPNVSICSSYSVLDNKSVFEKGQLFIPVSFFSKFCDGFKTEHTGKSFSLVFGKDFGFKTQTPAESSPLPYTDMLDIIGSEKPEFKSDLSEYEMYMNPENRDEYLILINQTHPLGPDYIPSDLVELVDTRRDGRAKQKMRLYAAKSLEALFIEMRANGFTDVSVTSGYRSYAYQQSLLNNEIALLRPSYGAKAEEQAKKQVAVPGTSEHQSGLCIDMHNLSSASQAFESQNAYKWLYSNCAKFGFILRFPKDKTDITGIIYEPWHYRYVGRYHAQKIMSQGLCLEEYMELIK